ncbi:fms-related tyrosine kinase 3 ligand isoform X2 [Vombatus ursinus]|uniref:fms-related tyrosine kinase 3 ligand isoform X2 n=1 Tax=Vombatus ursinus TaxID=29139 RepID=UPI000FFD646B|nr:fms-related tyrosine kinase 3 ligand isoform X2 [Vombatus ursinus]
MTAPAWPLTAFKLLFLPLLLPQNATASVADTCTFPDSPISSTFLQAISDLSDYVLRDYPVDVPANLQVDEQCWALWHLALAKQTLERLKLVAGSKLQVPLEAVYTEVNFVSQCINQPPGSPADPHHSPELPALPTVSLPARALHCLHAPLIWQSWGTGKHPETTQALPLSSAGAGGAANPAAADPGGCLEMEAKKEAVEATRIPQVPNTPGPPRLCPPGYAGDGALKEDMDVWRALKAKPRSWGYLLRKPSVRNPA